MTERIQGETRTATAKTATGAAFTVWPRCFRKRPRAVTLQPERPWRTDRRGTFPAASRKNLNLGLVARQNQEHNHVQGRSFAAKSPFPHASQLQQPGARRSVAQVVRETRKQAAQLVNPRGRTGPKNASTHVLLGLPATSSGLQSLALFLLDVRG